MSILFGLLSLMLAMADGNDARLAREAFGAARYETAARLSRRFLDENINSSVCTSEVLVAQLDILRATCRNDEEKDDLSLYLRRLYESIDPAKEGTKARSFLAIATGALDDDDINRLSLHDFVVAGDNRQAIDFYDTYVNSFPAGLLERKPLLRAWLPLTRAEILSYGGDFDNAEVEILKAETIINENFAADTPEHLIVPMVREIMAARSGDFVTAADMAMANLKALEAIPLTSKKGSWRETYATVGRLITYLSKIGKYDLVAEYATMLPARQAEADRAPALINFREIEGPSTSRSLSRRIIDVDVTLSNLDIASAAFACGNDDEASRRATHALYALHKQIGDGYAAFAFNRADNATRQAVDILVKSAPRLAVKAPDDSLLQTIAYDASLVSKQLSVSAGNFYRNVIARLGNDAISRRYQQLEQARTRLDNADRRNADSLIRQISLLEANIHKNISSRYPMSAAALPGWDDVRSHLDDHQIAVEFMTVADGDRRQYVAMIVDKSANFPKIISLGDITAVDNPDDIFAGSKVYEHLWQPIISRYPDATTIFFSPAGSLSLLPIEYAPDAEGNPVNSSLTMIRLSSTREIAQPAIAEHLVKARLYGGVKYDLNEVAVTTAPETSASSDEAVAVRAGLKYLPATLSEVEEIASIVDANGGSSAVVSGDRATESDVKSLSGNRLSALHIATHGFTLTGKSRSRLGRLIAAGDYRSTFDQQSLARSGLMFAGASNSINNPADISGEDGILNGREISRLDLSGVSLAVLSACESGLGEVNNEGIGGLQRSLKLAGVRTLMVSLWKVSDRATELLMTAFYRNLSEVKSPQSALRNAQASLREYPEFNDPHFWAPFILLDAI
ncbi:MAG: CHAT domain-containing protein [Lachnoclostridium sp.]|nr:CHAT domain-containing protein [Lachnoclostridium sp.]